MAKIIDNVTFLLGYVFTTFSALFTGTHIEHNGNTSVVLHSSNMVRYRSPLYVPITILTHDVDASRKIDTNQIRVTLVQRGWRAGFFGWSAAPYLGVGLKNGIDVTPEHTEKWGEQGGGDEAYEMKGENDTMGDDEEEGADDKVALLPKPALSSKRQTEIGKQLKSSTIEHGLPPHQVLTTMLVRIPASSGDGYFRFAVEMNKQPVAFSSTFRIYSLSLSSASPRGSSIMPPTLAPELLVRTVSTALYAALLALFPVAAIIEKVMPRSWARWMMTRLYRYLGMEQKTQSLMKDYNVQQRMEDAKAKVDRVPFAKAGIRTQFEIQRDQKRGAGGICYLYA